MADNYIERREEELRSSAGCRVMRRTPSLDTLLLRNRSHRAFDNSDPVAMLQLQTIVSVNTKLPSGRNAQTLRFKLLDAAGGGSGFCRLLHLGGYLPELNLPVPGTEPRAFDRSEVREFLSLPYEPLAVLAVGKGADKIELETVPDGSDLRYYRQKGIHFVPKIRIEDLVIN